MTTNIRKLTETCNENNLKLELRLLRQSPQKQINTNTQGNFSKEISTKPMKDRMTKKETPKYNIKVL